MNFKRIIKISSAVFVFLISGIDTYAQKDEKARKLLEAMSDTYDKTDGIDIEFGGTVNGEISLKGNMFVLDCDGIKTWFDGVTQWSYIKESNEINISSPTAEEQNMVNPYSIIKMYKNGFNYKYIGTKEFNGETCSEIMLIPEEKQNYEYMMIGINQKMEPVNIELVYSEDDKEVISVKKYKTNNKLTEDNFRFDMDAHPDAEIIDLR